MSDYNDRKFTILLVFAFIVGSLWDATTTFVGIVTIIGSSGVGTYGIAMTGMIIVLAFNLATRKIWKDFKDDFDNSFRYGYLNLVLIILWCGSILFDFITALEGNYSYVFYPKKEDPLVQIILIFLTLITTISPMMVNQLIADLNK